jgi:hypothetical protein
MFATFGILGENFVHQGSHKFDHLQTYGNVCEHFNIVLVVHKEPQRTIGSLSDLVIVRCNLLSAFRRRPFRLLRMSLLATFFDFCLLNFCRFPVIVRKNIYFFGGKNMTVLCVCRLVGKPKRTNNKANLQPCGCDFTPLWEWVAIWDDCYSIPVFCIEIYIHRKDFGKNPFGLIPSSKGCS